MSRVLLGITGGVDSSTSAWLLQRDNHEVVGVTLLFHDGPAARADREKAERVCQVLEIEHHVVDARKEFRTAVESYFMDQYAQGHTPDPCPLCTMDLKFPLLEREAARFGCDVVATGHYATITQDTYGMGVLPYQLRQALDRDKDQSHLLYGLSQETLSHTLFPLSGYTKPDARKIAMKAGLGLYQVAERKGPCFLEEEKPSSWLEARGFNMPAGDILYMATGKVVGTHEGLFRYDLGQHEGLGTSPAGDPLHVIAKDTLTNCLFVGSEYQTAVEKCTLADLHWTSIEPPEGKRSCRVKFQENQVPQPCQLTLADEGRAIVNFSEAVHGVVPGHTAVFYSDSMVLGGGVIVA